MRLIAQALWIPCFWNFFIACMTFYSTGDNQCGRIPVDLLQLSGLIWCGKKINKLLVFCCFHLTFAWYFCCFDVTQFNVLFCFESEDKIWWQYKLKHLCYENNFNCEFWFNWKPLILPLLDFFVYNWLNSVYCLF